MVSGECNSAVQWDTRSTVVKKRSKGFQRIAFGVYSRTYIEGYLGTVWIWDVGGRWEDRFFFLGFPLFRGKGLVWYLIWPLYSSCLLQYFPQFLPLDVFLFLRLAFWVYTKRPWLDSTLIGSCEIINLTTIHRLMLLFRLSLSFDTSPSTRDMRRVNT